MPILAKPIHQSIAPASLRILFLSEAFLSTDEELFMSYCKTVMECLLRSVSPFDFVASQVAAFAHFTPSDSALPSGLLPNFEQGTKYQYYINDDGYFVTDRVNLIYDEVDNLEVDLIGMPKYVPAGDVWLGTHKEARALYVVTKEAAREGINVVTTCPTTLKPSNSDIRHKAQRLIPFANLSLWPWSTSPQQSGHLESSLESANEQATLVFAHALGRCLGLGDESERPGAIYQGYSLPHDPQAAFGFGYAPNLVADATIRNNQGGVDLSKIKWAPQIEIERRLSTPIEQKHPSADGEMAEYKMAGEFLNAGQSVVILKHLNPAIPNELNYLEAPRRFLYTERPNLIEGGGGYRGGIYRPSVECIMRTYQPRALLKDWGGLPRVSYCRVCRDHLIKALTGVPNTRLGQIRIIKGSPEFSQGPYPSRLAEGFVQHIMRQRLFGTQPGAMGCTEATIRRFETFFNKVIAWPDTIPIRIKDFYQDSIKFPVLIGNGPQCGINGRTLPTEKRMGNMFLAYAMRYLQETNELLVLQLWVLPEL